MSLFPDLHAPTFDADAFAPDMRANILALFTLLGPMVAEQVVNRYQRTHGQHIDEDQIIAQLANLILTGHLRDSGERALSLGGELIVWEQKGGTA